MKKTAFRPGGQILVLSMIFTICFISSPSILEAIQGETSFPPYHVHLSWTDDPATSMTILWRTESQTESIVKYSKIDEAVNIVNGTVFKPQWDNSYIHTVHLNNLESGTEYSYMCGSSAGWSPEYYFITAPAEQETFSFLLAGDSRNKGYNDPSLEDWEAVVRAMREDMGSHEGGYDFFHFIGDNIYDGSQNHVWNSWLDILGIISDGIPFMESAGNHEYVYKTSTPHPQ